MEQVKTGLGPGETGEPRPIRAPRQLHEAYLFAQAKEKAAQQQAQNEMETASNSSRKSRKSTSSSGSVAGEVLDGVQSAVDFFGIGQGGR